MMHSYKWWSLLSDFIQIINSDKLYDDTVDFIDSSKYITERFYFLEA